MSKGFFIIINKPRPRRGAMESYWKSEPVQVLRGWQSMTSDSIEETMRLQKEQYFAMRDNGGPLPDLKGSNDGPMASGKMTRFVQVD